MNEDAIKQKVAQNIPQEEHVEAPPVTTGTTPEPSAFETNIELTDPAISLQLADFLAVSRVDRYSEETQRQLRELYRWGAERAQSRELPDVLLQLQMLENELGTSYKPDRLQILSKWVSLHRQSESLRIQMGYLYG